MNDYSRRVLRHTSNRAFFVGVALAALLVLIGLANQKGLL